MGELFAIYVAVKVILREACMMLGFTAGIKFFLRYLKRG